MTKVEFTPEQELKDPIFKEKGVSVWVKRDDLKHPLHGGNKWRKLQHHYQEALKLKADSIVSYGGPYSNHLLALASHSKIPTVGYVRGEILETNVVMQWCRNLGMRLIPTDRNTYINQNKTSGLDGKNQYHVPEGGSGSLGIKGVVGMVEELQNQYDYMVVSSGTGTTYKGIESALITAQLDTSLLVFWAIKGVKAKPDQAQTTFFEVHRGGFGKIDEDTISFAQQFQRDHHILLDPVYTTKSMMKLNELIQHDFFPNGSKILFIHTGGWTGWLSERNLKLVDGRLVFPTISGFSF